ncbi:DNA glycosylase AlkZ-like family protein [uncultured Cellulomonas sp.]|uniref:DNA glycosylase AlkZ-like family protein n=1 Tax=uncultured Cellulomonas sp. TaxID=189682 RepID=UPI0028ECC7A3|nr:crosslink repair DNA glycosylase YcaQ family protein [uncultured Cellulomonas sp.]
MAPDRLTWPQALAWRLRRQLLDPVDDVSVVDVVRAVGALPGQDDAEAELAIGARRLRPRPGDVARAVAAGELVRTFAFRGAVHLATPEGAGAYLALRASSRMWELPSWQTFYGLAPADWPAFRQAVRDALAGGPLTPSALGAVLTSQPTYRHLDTVFADNPWSLVKALAWQGDLCFGPSRDGQATLQRLDGNPRWTGLVDLDEAGRWAVEAYVRAYGPTTPGHLQYWLGEGLGVRRAHLRSWLADLADRLAPVEVDGEPAVVLHEDLAELVSTAPATSVRLLPRYDQWVLGPGTADPHVVPPAERALVSRGANLAVVGGVVRGTWSLSRDEVDVTWFAGTDAVARDDVAAQVERLATVAGRPLRLSAGPA